MMIASDLMRLLSLKYPVEKFLLVPECKIGSSWFKSDCVRFDLWAMARSWAHPQFLGFEVKVSRGDFLRDTKWQAYLPYCREFYFVAAPGIMEASEVPEAAGLLEASKTGNRLFCKKKAPVRSVEIPSSLFVYILMCRSVISRDSTVTRPSHEIWRERLAQFAENKKLGHELSWRIKKAVDAEVGDLKRENVNLSRENEKYRHVAEFLDDHGLKLDRVSSAYGVTNKKALAEALTGIPFDLGEFIKLAARNLNLAAEALSKVSGGKT